MRPLKPISKENDSMNGHRAGIIGCGNIAGWNELDPAREKPCTHIGAYRSRKDVKVIGCCDVNISRAKKFAEQFSIDFYTNSYADLLAKKINILSICIPYKLHHQVLKRVLNQKIVPKVIFLEKPISDDFNKAKDMVKLCKRKNVRLYVNNRRLSSFYQIFKKIIGKRFNNEIISLTAWCSSGMHTIGIHLVDLLRNICGEARWIFAKQEKERVLRLPYSHNYTPDDPRFSAFVGFNNGATASLFNSAKTDFTYFELEAVCKRGRIRASDNGKKIIYQEKLKPGKSTLSYRLGKEKHVRFKSIALFKQLIDEILDGNYKNSPINGGEALRSYQLIEAMKRSAKLNEVQYL